MGKKDANRQRRGGRTFTKTSYSLGVDGMKDCVFNSGGYKDAAKFNKNQKELSNYVLQSSEKGRLDIAKAIHNLKNKDMMTVAPTVEEEKLLGLAKDLWMDDY